MELAGLDPERIEALLLKFAGAGPRYTSYPTAPVGSEAYGAGDFARDLAQLEPGAPVSLYVHVPFCRSLCQFCACNRMVTRDAALPERYLAAIEREVEAIAAASGGLHREDDPIFTPHFDQLYQRRQSLFEKALTRTSDTKQLLRHFHRPTLLGLDPIAGHFTPDLDLFA